MEFWKGRETLDGDKGKLELATEWEKGLDRQRTWFHELAGGGSGLGKNERVLGGLGERKRRCWQGGGIGGHVVSDGDFLCYGISNITHS